MNDTYHNEINKTDSLSWSDIMWLKKKEKKRQKHFYGMTRELSLKSFWCQHREGGLGHTEAIFLDQVATEFSLFVCICMNIHSSEMDFLKFLFSFQPLRKAVPSLLTTGKDRSL